MEVSKKLKEAARNYIAKNYKNPTEMDFWIIYNAMLNGAQIVLDNEIDATRSIAAAVGQLKEDKIMKCILHEKEISTLCYGIHKTLIDSCTNDCEWRQDNYVRIFGDCISHKI